MAHHGGSNDKPTPEQARVLSELFERQDAADDIEGMMAALGATGRYPEGALTEDDEGELRIGITHTQGKIVVGFGKAIEWVGFLPEQAREIAQSLLAHAEACDGVETAVLRREVKEQDHQGKSG